MKPTPGKIGALFVVCYLAYSSIYIARLNISVASPLLMDMGIITKSQLGVIGGVFFFAFALGKVPNGYLGDRLPAKFMIAAGLLVVSLSNLAIGFMPAYASILILWGLNGVGQSMIWGPMLRIVTDHAGPERATLYGSLLVSSVAMGSVLGLIVGTKCATYLGALACFFIPGAITLAGLLLFWLVFRENRLDRARPASAVRVGELLRRPEFYVMFGPALFHGAIKDNVNLWIPSFYLDVYGIDIAGMANFIFVVPIIGFGGRMLFPVLYRMCGRNENRVSALSFAVCGLALVPLCLGGVSPLIATIGLGVVSAMISVINTAVLSVFPIRFADIGNVSFATGVMDLLTYGGAGVSSILFGFIIERHGYSGMFAAWCLLCAMSIASIAAFGVFYKRRDGLRTEQ